MEILVQTLSLGTELAECSLNVSEAAALFGDRTQPLKRVPISTEQFERHAHASDHYTALGCNSPRQVSPSARNINIQLLWFVNAVSLGLQLSEFRIIVVSSFSGSCSVSFSDCLTLKHYDRTKRLEL